MATDDKNITTIVDNFVKIAQQNIKSKALQEGLYQAVYNTMVKPATGKSGLPPQELLLEIFGLGNFGHYLLSNQSYLSNQPQSCTISIIVQLAIWLIHYSPPSEQ